MKLLMPGVYDDGKGSLHIDVGEVLRGHGLPDTPEERERAAELLAAAALTAGVHQVEVTE